MLIWSLSLHFYRFASLSPPTLPLRIRRSSPNDAPPTHTELRMDQDWKSLHGEVPPPPKNQDGARLQIITRRGNPKLIQVYLMQMDDYPADSCAISPTAFLLICKHTTSNTIYFSSISFSISSIYFSIFDSPLGCIDSMWKKAWKCFLLFCFLIVELVVIKACLTCHWLWANVPALLCDIV